MRTFSFPDTFISYSRVEGLLVGGLAEVAINVGRQLSVLVRISLEVILRQREHLDLVRLSLQIVMEGAMLSSALAFNPVLDFSVAHARGHLLSLNTVGHALHERVARVLLHVDRIERFHDDL